MSSISSRVAVAAHILAFLAWRRNEAVTSERIAESVNTNPVVVRRIVGALRNAGMVSVQPGPGGGAQLARAPGQITLLDVYRAVESDPLFALPPQPPCPSCYVGGTIQDALAGAFNRARTALEAALETTTLEDVWNEVSAPGTRLHPRTSAASHPQGPF